MSGVTPSLVPSRREFLRLLAAAGLSTAATHRPPFGPRLSAAGPLFEEVPGAASGISWVHDNAMSADRYLPETMGPGVAFLDFDNDGWMDVFMVNSGRSDFYQPKTPIRNALYRN
ncbi:MAG: VCBS repeat-containing protein, partial [Vicinamibacterales bacterium]